MKNETAALDRKIAFWEATKETHKTDKRNADLVPILLDALENLLTAANKYPDLRHRNGASIFNAHAAIAKARNE